MAPLVGIALSITRNKDASDLFGGLRPPSPAHDSEAHPYRPGWPTSRTDAQRSPGTGFLCDRRPFTGLWRVQAKKPSGEPAAATRLLRELGITGLLLLTAASALAQEPRLQILPPLAPRAVPQIDPDLPSFQPSGRAGRLILGSSMVTLPLAEPLQSSLQAAEPELRIRLVSIEAERGAWWQNRPGATALLAGPMSPREQQAFRRSQGYSPLAVRVAMDPIVVAVHPQNPLPRQGLDMPALAGIFRHQPAGDSTRYWGDLGLGPPWQQRWLEVLGYQSSVPLYHDFRRAVLRGASFRRDMARLPSTEAVIAALTSRRTAIGFLPLRDVNPRVAVVPLARAGQEPVLPTPATISDGRYPLPRFVYLYLNVPPQRPLPETHLALVEFLFSREGQQLVARTGLLPLPSAFANPELERLRQQP